MRACVVCWCEGFVVVVVVVCLDERCLGIVALGTRAISTTEG